MRSMLSDVLKKLRKEESKLEALTQEFHGLEAQKQGYLQEIMKGGQRSAEMAGADEAIREKGHLISETKEQVGNLRVQLELLLTRFREKLTEEKQNELAHRVEERTQYLKRIEELEVEISRYRYLISGKRDHRLAKEKDPLPLEARGPGEFSPIDEIIGHKQLEISKINRMNSRELLDEYLATGGKDGREGPDGADL
jgi:chromosome segregation ATPase